MPRKSQTTFAKGLMTGVVVLPPASALTLMAMLAERKGVASASELAFDYTIAAQRSVNISQLADPIKFCEDNGFITKGERTRKEGEKGKGSAPITLTEDGRKFLIAYRDMAEKATGTTFLAMPIEAEQQAAA